MQHTALADNIFRGIFEVDLREKASHLRCFHHCDHLLSYYLLACWVINSPKGSAETMFLLCFFLLFFFFYLVFFPPQFCPNEFSVTTGRIVVKFGDMVDMDVKMCKSFSKFKMSDYNWETV